jgi:hypothetical protein
MAALRLSSRFLKERRCDWGWAHNPLAEPVLYRRRQNERGAISAAKRSDGRDPTGFNSKELRYSVSGRTAFKTVN